MQKYLILLGFASLLYFSQPVDASPYNGIAAVVNDELITISELNREFEPALKEEEKQRGTLTAADVARLRLEFLNSMIDGKLVRQKIKELNIVISDEDVRQSIEEVKRQNKFSQEALVAALKTQGLTLERYKVQLRDQLEKVRLMSLEVKAKVQVSEREINEYYNRNKEQFTEEPTYRARHIFLQINKNASTENIKKVMTKAAEVTAEATSGADFVELAKKYSDDPGARKDGGDLGVFKKGDMLPEIENAVITMSPGEISELVSTQAGFHIIKLEEKNPGKLKPLDTVRASIEELLYRKKSEERFRQWTVEIRKGAVIEIKI